MHIAETVEKLVKKYDTRDPYELCRLFGIKIHESLVDKTSSGDMNVSTMGGKKVNLITLLMIEP